MKKHKGLKWLAEEMRETRQNLGIVGMKKTFWKRPRPIKKGIGKRRALRIALIKHAMASLKMLHGSVTTTKNENGTYTHTFTLVREGNNGIQS